VAQGYAVQGSDEPHAYQGLGVNRCQRIAASLDVMSGKLFSWQCRRFDRSAPLRRSMSELIFKVHKLA